MSLLFKRHQTSVVQRFGNVKRLITQTLDPILTAFFRDIAQKNSMLDLLVKREAIQQRQLKSWGIDSKSTTLTASRY